MFVPAVQLLDDGPTTLSGGAHLRMAIGEVIPSTLPPIFFVPQPSLNPSKPIHGAAHILARKGSLGVGATKTQREAHLFFLG